MNLINANDIFHRISEEKQNIILEAALTEFAQFGYSEANINKIAERAHVSVGSIYKYFNDKQNLYLAIINYSVETLRTVLNQIMDGNDDFFGTVEKIIEVTQKYSKSKVNFAKLYNEMTTENNSELAWKTAADVEGVTAKLYASLIEEAQRKGVVKKDIDPRYFAFFIDNLFILLQFSYSCDYYKERLKMFVGEEAFEDDALLRAQLMKFIRGALCLL